MRAGREFATSGAPNFILPYTARGRFANPSDHFREGSYPPTGAPGTDLEFTLSDHIESGGIAAAIVTHGEARWVDTNPNPYYAAAVAQAANDWLVAGMPAARRAPVRLDHRVQPAPRAGRRGDPPDGRQPAHEAGADGGQRSSASRSAIPYSIRSTRRRRRAAYRSRSTPRAPGGVTPAAAAQGTINYFLDFYTLIPETFMSHLTSFITHGVFERYPKLRLVFLESGATWIAPFLWRLDANYKGLRREIPWTQRPPSEYLQSHVRVSVGPLDRGPDLRALVAPRSRAWAEPTSSCTAVGIRGGTVSALARSASGASRVVAGTGARGQRPRMVRDHRGIRLEAQFLRYSNGLNCASRQRIAAVSPSRWRTSSNAWYSGVEVAFSSTASSLP